MMTLGGQAFAKAYGQMGLARMRRAAGWPRETAAGFFERFEPERANTPAVL